MLTNRIDASRGISLSAAVCLATLAALFWAPVLLCVLGSANVENNHDEHSWHLPAIRQIAAKWPALDLRADCLSASSPGHHWMLAGLSLLTGQSLASMRLWNACLGFAIIVLVFRWMCPRIRVVETSLLLAPLAISNFVIKSSAWVLTDNAGLLFATAAMLALFSQSGAVGVRKSALYSTVAIVVRQIHAWLLAPIIVAAWIDGGGGRSRLERLSWCLLPVGAIGILLWAWGGPVPPQWRLQNTGLTSCPQAFLLSLSVIFLLVITPARYLSPIQWHKEKNWVLAAGIAGLSSALLTPTSYDHDAGRWGGYLWDMARVFPVIADRSLLFIVAAPLGAAMWMLLWRGLMGEGAGNNGLFWGVGLLAWAGSFVVCRQVFQRYFEPMILVFMITGICLVNLPRLDTSQRWRILALTIMQAGITTATAVLPAFQHAPLVK